jgi:hypothetical protein
VNPPDLSPKWARHKIEREDDGTFTIIFSVEEGKISGSVRSFKTKEEAQQWVNKHVFTKPLPKTIRRNK